MLVLSRKKGERIVIDGRIRVVVLAVQGDRVKLGFEGPANVPIHREEVFERIMREAAIAQLEGPRHDALGARFDDELLHGGGHSTGSIATLPAYNG